MINLLDCSDTALSLEVFNTEELYNIRHKVELFAILDKLYVYNEEQRQELLNDLMGDMFWF